MVCMPPILNRVYLPLAIVVMRHNCRSTISGRYGQNPQERGVHKEIDGHVHSGTGQQS